MYRLSAIRIRPELNGYDECTCVISFKSFGFVQYMIISCTQSLILYICIYILTIKHI